MTITRTHPNRHSVAQWPGAGDNHPEGLPSDWTVPGWEVLIREQHEELRDLFADVVACAPEASDSTGLADLVSRMAAHVSAERSFLYPALRRTGGPAAAQAIRLKRDYQDISRPLLAIEARFKGSPDLPDLVDLLQEAFEEHCGHIAAALGALSEDELGRVAGSMSGAESLMSAHPHPRLLSFGPLGPLTSRWAARLERARDVAAQSREEVGREWDAESSAAEHTD